MEEGKPTYYCFVCNIDHSVKTPTRRKILFTSSTLINFWKCASFIPSVHFEVEAIVGGKVRDLTKVFKNIFGEKPAPLDAVLCCGINNVGERQSETDTLKKFADFQNTVYEHSTKHKHEDMGLGKTQSHSPQFCSRQNLYLF